jgi:hypothetical protein
VSLTQQLSQARAAQGGVALGPEQGELGVNFGYLGIDFKLGRICGTAQTV